MNMHKNGNDKSGIKLPDTQNDIKKYLRLIQKRKWQIAITTVLIYSAWLIYIILFQSTPVYNSSVLLHFQNSKNISAVQQSGAAVNTSRITFLETNKLLGKIVEELHLNLSVQTDEVSKDALFTHLDVPANSIPGFYTLIRSDSVYQLHYQDEAKTAKAKHLSDHSAKDTVSIPEYHLTFKLNETFLKEHSLKQIEFKVRNFDLAINHLKEKISYRWVDRKSRTNLSITAQSRSPQMAARIANTLATRFVEFDSYIKNRKSNETAHLLENQLQVAKRELASVNRQLQQFREKYPEVNVPQSLPSQSSLQQDQADLLLKIGELKTLATQVKQSDNFDEKLANSRQLLSHLIAEGVSAGMALEVDLKQQITEHAALINQWSPTHPILAKTEEKIESLIQKIEKNSREHRKRLNTRLRRVKSQLNQARIKQNALPHKQRLLSELISEQGVKKRLYETILTRYKEAEINTVVEVGDIFILDEARVPPPQPFWSLILTKSFVGLLLGVIMGIGLAVIQDFFDKTVRSSEELSERLKLPVLASIPVIPENPSAKKESIKDSKGKRDQRLVTLDYTPTLASEIYRDLRTKLLFANQHEGLSSMLITSLNPSEGKSLNLSNIAITFAQQKLKTLLIDGDLRRGVLHNVFGNKKEPGLSNFLSSGAAATQENINPLIQKTLIPNLYLIPTGPPIPNPTEMLGSERMADLLKEMKSRFKMVLLDTAPIQASSDASVLAAHMDGILIVVRANYTNLDIVEHRLREYPNLTQQLLGLLLNMATLDEMNKQRYQYSYYNY